FSEKLSPIEHENLKNYLRIYSNPQWSSFVKKHHRPAFPPKADRCNEPALRQGRLMSAIPKRPDCVYVEGLLKSRQIKTTRQWITYTAKWPGQPVQIFDLIKYLAIFLRTANIPQVLPPSGRQSGIFGQLNFG